jgi:hypothetical protein
MSKFQTIFDKYRERYGIKEAASVPQPTPSTATTSTDDQEDAQPQQTGQETPTGSNQTNQTDSASTQNPTQSTSGTQQSTTPQNTAPQNTTKPATPENAQLQQIFANPALKDTLIAAANAAKVDVGGIQPNAANVDLAIQNKISAYINSDRNGQFKQALINAINGKTNG